MKVKSVRTGAFLFTYLKTCASPDLSTLLPSASTPLVAGPMG